MEKTGEIKPGKTPPEHDPQKRAAATNVKALEQDPAHRMAQQVVQTTKPKRVSDN